MMQDDNWFSERYYYKSVINGYKVKKVLHEEKSQWQEIAVYETQAVGKLLTLDGKTMVSDLDEFVYHETMAHISSMTHPDPKKVLIIGGGDGGLVREFVKYPSLEEIQLVEIDERVIEVSKEFFPNCTSGLSDSRVKIVPTDGIKYIGEFENYFDIIIIDSTDPEEFAEGLFTKEFYSTVNKALTKDGIMMAQTENPFFDEYNIGDIYKNLKASFKNVQAVHAPMSIYPGVYWTFAFCSKGINGIALNSERIPFMSDLQKSLEWYNMDWHKAAFVLPNFTKRKLGLE
jgi:spermidine synthase